MDRRISPRAGKWRGMTRWLAAICALWLGLLTAAPAQAANCNVATSQGTTGPANYNTYCWIDFSTYSQATASSASGQNFSLTLQDGTVVSFNLKVSGVSLTAVASPSWSGAAVGNTAFVGIAGKPILYDTAGGTTNVTISNIVLTPPSGGTSATAYMFVVADGESTNCGESLAFTTNGGNWTLLDSAGATDGSTSMPSTTGIGTTSITESGTTCGYTGSHIFGTTTPTTITSTIVGGAVELAQAGEWPVALIILLASVAIPISKFIAIAYLALSVERHSHLSPHARIHLYDFVEFIGRWSMIDVFVVAILSALVQLGFLAAIHPGLAALFFAMSVVFTMLSAQAMDPRLIWDGAAQGTR